MATSAREICEKLLLEIRASNLNFVVHETPYSAQICLRKRFIKEANGPSTSISSSSPTLKTTELEDSIAALQNEKDDLETKLEESERNSSSYMDTIAILEEKVEKAEAGLYNYMAKNRNSENEKNQEIKVLKGAIKNTNDELQNKKIEINQIKKVVKVKEKENYNLETKVENQANAIKSLKETCNSQKREKQKLEKELKRKRKAESSKSKDIKKDAPDKLCVVDPTSASTDKIEADISKSNPFSALEKTVDEQNHSDKALETPTPDCRPHDLNFNSASIPTPTVDLPCVVCGETFTSAPELREHRQKKHSDMKYTCKLCDETYQTEEDLFSHRIGEYHQSLSKAVSDQFNIEVGNSCEECSVIQTPEETFYSFCENDHHYDSFENIWNSFKKEFREKVET